MEFDDEIAFHLQGLAIDIPRDDTVRASMELPFRPDLSTRMVIDMIRTAMLIAVDEGFSLETLEQWVLYLLNMTSQEVRREVIDILNLCGYS